MLGKLLEGDGAVVGEVFDGEDEGFPGLDLLDFLLNFFLQGFLGQEAQVLFEDALIALPYAFLLPHRPQQEHPVAIEPGSLAAACASTRAPLKSKHITHSELKCYFILLSHLIR